MSGSLLVVTGPPGAGKSTVSVALAARYDRSVLVEGDAFFAFLASGAIEPWLPESNDQNAVVSKAAAVATGAFVKGGYATVYDGVMGPWFLPTFAEATGLPALHYVILLPEVERLVTRVATREGHGFASPEATRKMHDEFARAEIDERHVLRDPPEGVDAVADRIAAALADGRLRYDVKKTGAGSR